MPHLQFRKMGARIYLVLLNEVVEVILVVVAVRLLRQVLCGDLPDVADHKRSDRNIHAAAQAPTHLLRHEHLQRERHTSRHLRTHTTLCWEGRFTYCSQTAALNRLRLLGLALL